MPLLHQHYTGGIRHHFIKHLSFVFVQFLSDTFHFLLSHSNASPYEGTVRPVIYYHELFNLISISPKMEGRSI